MIAATEQPASQLCAACFTGQYPIELPPADRMGKYLLEQSELPLGAPEDGLLSIVPSVGGSSALDHP
jgi:amidophosphoribosyltransferase